MAEDPVNQEVKVPVADTTATKEVARESTLKDFMDYKTTESERAASAFNAAMQSGEAPFGTSFGALTQRASELREQVDMLNNLVDSRASDLKDRLHPDLPPFWEMNEGEKDMVRRRVKNTPLSESISWYGDVIDGFETDYKEKYGGKSYDDMSTKEEGEARDDNDALGKMHKLHDEMLDFKPQPTSKPQATQ